MGVSSWLTARGADEIRPALNQEIVRKVQFKHRSRGTERNGQYHGGSRILGEDERRQTTTNGEKLHVSTTTTAEDTRKQQLQHRNRGRFASKGRHKRVPSGNQTNAREPWGRFQATSKTGGTVLRMNRTPSDSLDTVLPVRE